MLYLKALVPKVNGPINKTLPRRGQRARSAVVLRRRVAHTERCSTMLANLTGEHRAAIAIQKSARKRAISKAKDASQLALKSKFAHDGPNAIGAHCRVKSSLLGQFAPRYVACHPGVGLSIHKSAGGKSGDALILAVDDHYSMEELIWFEMNDSAKQSRASFTVQIVKHTVQKTKSLRFRCDDEQSAAEFEALVAGISTLAQTFMAEEPSDGGPKPDVAHLHVQLAKHESVFGVEAAPRECQPLPESTFALQAWLSEVHVDPLLECIREHARSAPPGFDSKHRLVDRAGFVEALRSAVEAVPVGGITLTSDDVGESASLLYAAIAAASRAAAESDTPDAASASSPATTMTSVTGALAVLCRGDDHETHPIYDEFAKTDADRMSQSELTLFLRFALPIFAWPLNAQLRNSDAKAATAMVAKGSKWGRCEYARVGGGNEDAKSATATRARSAAGEVCDAAGMTQVDFGAWLADERRLSTNRALSRLRRDNTALHKLAATQRTLSATLAASAAQAQKARAVLQAELDESMEMHRAMREHVNVLLANVSQRPSALATSEEAAVQAELDAAHAARLAAERRAEAALAELHHAKQDMSRAAETPAQRELDAEVVTQAHQEVLIERDETVALLQKSFEMLRVASEAKDGTIAALRDEHKAKDAALIELKAERVASEAKDGTIAALRDEHKAKDAALIELKAERVASEAKDGTIAALRDEHKAKDAILVQLNAELEALRRTSKQLQAEKDVVVATVASKTAQIAAHEETHAERDAALAELQAQHALLGESSAATHAAKAAEMESVQGQLAESAALHASKDSTLTELGAELQRVSALLKECEARSPALQDAIALCRSTDAMMESLSAELHQSSAAGRDHDALPKQQLLEEIDAAVFAERKLFHRIFAEERVATSAAKQA